MGTYIVTIKLPRNSAHNPQNKLTGTCPFSEHCTDYTGEHHSTIVIGANEAVVRKIFSDYRITRIELVPGSESVK